MLGISKKELRIIAKQKRSLINKPDAPKKLCVNFLNNIKLKPNSIIASYCPTQSEIDVSSLNLKLIELGHKICLPIIDGEVLKFHDWNGKEELVAGKFGIKIPNPNSQTLTPNYVIIPLLAFDPTKHRLGYGGGYYDRTLKKLNAIKIGVAYAEQELESIPAEKTDIQLDFIVTDEKLF